jgi:predicted nuclease of predicted toxin-antitoxin system
VKFLVDANLPRRLAHWLNAHGHEAIHTLDLPKGSDTDDREIIRFANDEQRIIVTRDGDFQLAFEMRKGPPGLVLISIGNCTNAELLAHLEKFSHELFAACGVGVMVDVQWSVLVISNPNSPS